MGTSGKEILTAFSLTKTAINGAREVADGLASLPFSLAPGESADIVLNGGVFGEALSGDIPEPRS